MATIQPYGDSPYLKNTPTSAPVSAPAQQTVSKFSGKGNPYNEISYLKNMYETSDSQGKKNWAANEAKKYYNMLDPQESEKISKMNSSAMKNYMGYQQQQEKAMAPVDPNQYRTESATIDDIAKKYGFDFSRDYAKRQAEAEAQARRNANADAQRRNESNRDLNLQSIDNNLMGMAEDLDRNYFQKYMQQAQNQVNSGLNAGIASDQDLRLAMSRQAEMGDAYRDANLGRMQENQRFSLDDIRLAEELGLIDQQALAREDSLFNDRLMQGAGLAMDTDRLNISQNMALLDAAMNQRAQNIGVNQFDRQFDRGNYEWQQEFDRSGEQWQSQFDWGKMMDEAGLTGYYNGDPTFDRERWKTEFDWGKYMDQQNLALAKSRGYGGGGGRSSSVGSASGTLGSLWSQFQQDGGSTNDYTLPQLNRTLPPRLSVSSPTDNLMTDSERAKRNGQILIP